MALSSLIFGPLTPGGTLPTPPGPPGTGKTHRHVSRAPQFDDEDEDEPRRRRHRRSPFANWPPLREILQTYQEGYRVSDASLDRYELFAAVDGPVDFEASGQPVSTSPTVAGLTWTPPLPGPGLHHDLHLVCRKRDQWGLSSFNVFETILRIDHLGAQVSRPPSAPTNVVVYDGGSETLRVVASYLSIDDAAPADTWEVYVKIGSDPVPGVDVPAYSGLMGFAGCQSAVSQLVSNSTWVAGSGAHVIVCSKRTADGARAASGVVLFAIPASLDLESLEGFGGGAYEQGG